MHGVFVFGLMVLAAGITVTSAKPSLPPLCRAIRRNGCTSQLKQTGKVCGTDSKTYRNACLLNKKACKYSSYLKIAYYAPCRDSPLQIRAQKQAGGTAREGTGSRRGYNEIGDTPDDDEDMPYAANPQGTPVNPGLGTSSASSEEVGAGGGGGGAGGAGATMRPPTTDFPPLSPGAKVCPDMCPKPSKQDLVCASDDKNYGSVCLLQQYRCQTKENIYVVHQGLCRNACGPKCPMVYEPVCGTDDLTYMSRCDLERTACLTQDQTLQVAYNQECAGAALLKGCPECEPIEEPVCSTNNMTFRSKCEFDRFVCIFDVRGIGIADYNESCPNAPLVCPNYCEQIDDPVCGSDGVTYPNICELGVADCKAKSVNPLTSITFVSYGDCAAGEADPCSPNSPDCELLEDPVCATKGAERISYFNRCFMEKDKCFDPSIKYLSDGICMPTQLTARGNFRPGIPKARWTFNGNGVLTAVDQARVRNPSYL